jgi:hypothetical protein
MSVLLPGLTYLTLFTKLVTDETNKNKSQIVYSWEKQHPWADVIQGNNHFLCLAYLKPYIKLKSVIVSEETQIKQFKLFISYIKNKRNKFKKYEKLLLMKEIMPCNFHRILIIQYPG